MEFVRILSTSSTPRQPHKNRVVVVVGFYAFHSDEVNRCRGVHCSREGPAQIRQHPLYSPPSPTRYIHVPQACASSTAGTRLLVANLLVVLTPTGLPRPLLKIGLLFGSPVFPRQQNTCNFRQRYRKRGKINRTNCVIGSCAQRCMPWRQSGSDREQGEDERPRSFRMRSPNALQLKRQKRLNVRERQRGRGSHPTPPSPSHYFLATSAQTPEWNAKRSRPYIGQ